MCAIICHLKNSTLKQTKMQNDANHITKMKSKIENEMERNETNDEVEGNSQTHT